jgi:hypothetical protein
MVSNINLARISSVLILILFGAGLASAQLDLSALQDPGHKAYSSVGDVKFSVPNEFELNSSPGAGLAYMSYIRSPLGLFVAVPETPVNDEYLASLTQTVAALFLADIKNYKWKVVPSNGKHKVSKFQTASGFGKGLAGKSYIHIDYVAVKIENRDVLIGYILKSGAEFESSAKVLYEMNDQGLFSMSGWYAQAHVIASVTGERYRDINPGTTLSVPVPEKRPDLKAGSVHVEAGILKPNQQQE